MKRLLKRYSIYIITPIIAILLLGLVYYIKNIIPFGNNNIIEADLGQSYVSIYYYLRSVVFSSKSLLWSFNFIGGTTFEWIAASNSFYSPLTLILCFVSPDKMVSFMPIFLMIKISLMALTTSIFLRNTFKKVSNFYVILFSLIYSFSGYVLLSYHNIIWMDSLIYFPLLVYSILHLFKKKEVIPFIIMLTLQLWSSYYISYMIIIAIITCGSIYIMFKVPKKDHKEVMLKGVLGVIVSLLLSLPIILPVVIQTPLTYRYLYWGDMFAFKSFMTKFNFYLCSSVLVVIPFISLIKDILSNNKKELLFWGLLILPLLLGLFIEPINLAWHGGSYVAFPYRYGFIPLFFLICLSINYFNNYESKIKLNFNFKEILKIALFLIIAFLISIVFKSNAIKILNYDISMGIYKGKVLVAILNLFYTFLIGFTIIMLFKNNILKYIMIGLFAFAELLVNSYMYIGREDKVIENYDQKSRLFLNAETYKEKFNIKDDYLLNRYKDTTATMSENYSFALDVPTIGGWSQLITYDQFNLHNLWGYSTRYTRLQDLGGTLFSDAFYHIKYVFSKEKLSSNIYSSISSYNNVTLYQKDTLPLGILHNNNSIKSTNNTFEFQNEVYQKLFEKEDNIIEILDSNYEQKENCLTKNIKLNASSNIYLINSGSQISKIVVNGKTIYISAIGYNNTTMYPVVNNKGILDLGTYIDDVTIKLYGVDNNKKEEISIGYIEENKYNNFIKENENDNKVVIKNNRLFLTINNYNKEKYLLLPVTYIDGCKAYINDKKVAIDPYMGNYINFKLESGINNIEIKFYPKYYKELWIIFAITIAISIIIILLNKKYHFDQNTMILNIGYYIFIVASILTFIYMYIYSLIKFS